MAATKLTSNLLLRDFGLSPFGTVFTSRGSFALTSFYFACGVATDTGAVGAAEACSVAIVGFDESGTVVADASFDYAAMATVYDAMALATLPPSFRLLANVTIGSSDHFRHRHLHRQCRALQERLMRCVWYQDRPLGTEMEVGCKIALASLRWSTKAIAKHDVSIERVKSGNKAAYCNITVVLARLIWSADVI